MKKAAFLDRDGVLNRTVLVKGIPRPPKTPDEIEILDGVIEGVQLLRQNSILPVVVTNQPDVARGTASMEDVGTINMCIGEKLSIEHFYTCFHDDLDSCFCRKPSPGLILQAASDLQIDLSRSFLVGDRWRDIAAGQAVGCEAFFIDYSYPEKQPDMPFIKVHSLLDAVQYILGVNDGI